MLDAKFFNNLPSYFKESKYLHIFKKCLKAYMLEKCLYPASDILNFFDESSTTLYSLNGLYTLMNINISLKTNLSTSHNIFESHSRIQIFKEIYLSSPH